MTTSRLPELLRDSRNVALLRLLRDDPRISVADLARRIGMSPPAMRERLSRLEEAGIVSGYRVVIDPRALGVPVCAYVRVRPAPGQLGRAVELARQTPEVVECHRITGEDALLMKVHVAALDALDATLDRFAALGQVATSIVQSTPVPLRNVPLPSEPPPREVGAFGAGSHPRMVSARDR